MPRLVVKPEYSKSYRKLARILREPPWQLDLSATYLEAIAAGDLSQATPLPPTRCISFAHTDAPEPSRARVPMPAAVELPPALVDAPVRRQVARPDPRARLEIASEDELPPGDDPEQADSGVESPA